MQNIDLMSLDGRSLRVFLVVFEEMSVSRAAERLDLTQSTVSHILDKLRKGLGDPLFVRYGRGIAATERAAQLRDPIQTLVDDFSGLMDDRPFDPTAEVLRFTIAANDFQRDFIFPDLLRSANEQDVDLRLHFFPSGVPKQKLLYEAHCDLIVTPQPPEGRDIIQTRLFETKHVCYYDPDVRQPPTDLDEYYLSRHAAVRFEDHANSWEIIPAQLASEERMVVVSVPNFEALPKFVRGTDMIATEFDVMKKIMRPLRSAPAPFEPRAGAMYMAWHRRDQREPAHRWLRDQVKALSVAAAA